MNSHYSVQLKALHRVWLPTLRSKQSFLRILTTLWVITACFNHTWVCCVARWLTSNSFEVIVTAIIWKRHLINDEFDEWCIFSSCNCCSWFSDIFISMFGVSAHAAAFQRFARKHWLQILGLRMCSITWNLFPLKIVCPFTHLFVAFVETSDSSQNQSPVHASFQNVKQQLQLSLRWQPRNLKYTVY